MKYILFKAYTSGSGNKKVQILDKYYEPVLNYPITSKSWAAHIIDVAPYSLDFANKDYYFQAQTEGAANASLMIDDIRIVSTTLENCPVMVDKVTSSKTWVAQPKISDTASDFFIHIEATDSTGAKTIRSEMINPVSQSDYDIKVITHSPQEQIKGKTVTFTAVVVNNGANTNVVSELSWFTCNESEGDCSIDNNWQKKYKEAQTDTVSPLDSEMQYTSTFLLTTAFGNNRVIAYCDSGEVIVEPDDNSNPTDLNNNLKDDSIEIKKPDLRISKIGYSPADPVDGENVIFYAQIENVYKGGTIDEVETQFKVTDENGVETTIDAEKTGNEVMFARRRPVFDNSDFEQKSLNNWISQGTVFLEKEPLSDSYKVIESLYDAKDDQYYAKVYGDGSRLLSQEFRIVGSESSSIIFKGQSTGSGTKQIFVRQYPTYGNPTSSDPILESLTFSEKSPWKVGIIDVSAHHNKNVYLEVLTSGADNSEFWVDDFRMADGSDPVFVSIVQAKNPWIAVPGNHTLLAQVDSNNNIPENDESNPNGEANNTLEKTFNPTNSVDYSITTMTYTPEEQVQGKDIVFTAVIKNDTPNTTLIESELEWFVCQGDIKYCDYQEKWESKAKEKVAGLTAYGEYTSTFNMEVTYSTKEPTSDQSYLLQVKVVCDTGNVITEDAKPDSELNNEAVSSIQIYHPDLEIGDIWWLPENPVYGESVKFFARIDNFGKGGTVQDFEVSFIVDYEDTDNSVDLGTTKMTIEVPFGMREPLPVNPSFENGLKGWTVLSGNVNWESICPENDSHCPGENAKNRYGDLYYASVYGDNSIFRTTNAFQKKGNSLLFRGYTSGSGTKKLVIYDTNNTNLLERTYTDKSPWRAYVINIQEIEDNTDIYIEIQTNGASNATFMVDDFRMGENNSERSIVGYVESKSAWTAQPDFPAKVHSISAIVDSKAVVKEVKDDLANDNKSDEDIPSIGRPDYQVAITDYSPRKQIQGRNMQFTAVIDNPYSTTLVDSELQWSICQDSLITCKDGDEYKKYWEIKQTDKMIGGIAEGQQYTVFFNLTVPSYVGTEPEENPDGYTIYVRAKADVNSAILEKDDADANSFIQQVEIDHPDLIVKEIWWIPESPIDGQEVTFYAQIANQGNGGTLEDYEVNFVVDKGNELTEEDLGTAKIQDDIPLGNRLPLLSNANAIGITKNIGDFEGEPILAKSDAWPITNWMRYSGDIYIANHFQDSQLPNSENKKPDNLKYLYISGTGARVKSPPFQLWGDALMFRGQANGSGNKTVRIWLYDPNDPDNENQTPLHEELYNDKSPWRAYLIDIEKWHKFMVYLEIETSNGSFFVDDFRMIQAPQYTQGAIIVATAANPKTWLARNGAKITAEVDPKQDIYEDPRIINLNKRMASDRYTRPFSWHGENNNILTRTIILKNSNSLGDIDANGEKNLKDLILAAKIAASFDFPFNDGFILDNVDVDGDNDIGLAEMIYLMVYIAEKQDSH
ncbi:MAG: hypothetical protein OMM_01269 [Candidatus Magnetoglobus multicellularis str. Araruama]|uniref:CARDB domain-containing protein n=1 Tax=Candidatus Magnetoglobus multicellularis str. Araruama TaxID=890399 RepID=A0A1V1PE11_9BACT|nr:MAG: hypothetical protein OMM_01269 [Candidatus Magnetoglobus multicellularis str. Araruama]